MINLNSPISSTGSTSSITIPKVNATATQGNSNASTSSSASSSGPATRVDISEQAMRMKPARFSVSPDRKYDVLAEMKKVIAEREGKTNNDTKANETAATETKSSKPARFAVDPSKKFDVLVEVKKSVAAREAAANDAAKNAAVAG